MNGRLGVRLCSTGGNLVFPEIIMFLKTPKFLQIYSTFHKEMFTKIWGECSVCGRETLDFFPLYKKFQNCIRKRNYGLKLQPCRYHYFEKNEQKQVIGEKLQRYKTCYFSKLLQKLELALNQPNFLNCTKTGTFQINRCHKIIWHTVCSTTCFLYVFCSSRNISSIFLKKNNIGVEWELGMASGQPLRARPL